MRDIILTGPKHSGKTKTGKVLASLLSEKQPFPFDFIDLDESIQKRTGKSPRELYYEGQKVFQKAEAEAIEDCFVKSTSLRSLTEGKPADAITALLAEGGEPDGGTPGRRVIAAGGGIIDNGEAVSVINKSGALKVYLNVSAETAWHRIARKRELPPFLRTENPRETHRILHERRAAEYLKTADIVIDAEGKTVEKIAEEILEKVTG
jgi:shikimate kinase